MVRISRHEFDVLVIGAGPAGIAAAVRAAECGARVGIVDDNATPGGQIWRGSGVNDHLDKDPTEETRWCERLRTLDIAKLFGRRVFDQPEAGILLAEEADGLCELHYRSLVLATGARERFLPFPGWTLPNVMGAGGLQAMVKSGLPVRGKRVVVAGTGPLLLAVAAYLRKHGAQILLVCEQASLSRLARFGFGLLGYPDKLIQGYQLKKALAGVPFAASSWPVVAGGKRALESVTILRSGKTEVVECDYLACGFHLVPNVELPCLLGCKINGGFVQVDDFQQTSIPGIFCAGEPTGIGGVELALIEGEIAGFAAAGGTKQASKMFGARQKAQCFARMLDHAFCLRRELRKLSSADTIVCRCEDVPYSRLMEQQSWRAAKLQTRCGMGPCQGRVCGPATQFLFQWNPDSFRPPIFPARVDSMAAVQAEPEHIATTGESQ
jgi:NADPH-dependent 2,4-dienoyl-CoA reductase/sulfur reductase-like enzyme